MSLVVVSGTNPASNAPAGWLTQPLCLSICGFVCCRHRSWKERLHIEDSLVGFDRRSLQAAGATTTYCWWMGLQRQLGRHVVLQFRLCCCLALGPMLLWPSRPND